MTLGSQFSHLNVRNTFRRSHSHLFQPGRTKHYTDAHRKLWVMQMPDTLDTALVPPQNKPATNNWFRGDLTPVKEQAQNLYKYTVKIQGRK